MVLCVQQRVQFLYGYILLNPNVSLFKGSVSVVIIGCAGNSQSFIRTASRDMAL